ncbi:MULTISPECIES: hypothetical protein [unclassified Nostoc]|uniref:hypothetical protein n=1 Tax=unclassified Nostoc TaxID=2593658 RepID=UPI002635136C|nr:hypothetical protein [Nostoc sp. S13]
MGNGVLGMGKNLPVWPMPNAPSDGATIPLHPLLGWSFPSLSMKPRLPQIFICGKK